MDKKESYTEKINRERKQTAIISYVALGISLLSLLSRLMRY